MNRSASKALAATLVCAACAGAKAQTTVSTTVYGLLDVSVGHFQELGEASTTRVESGRMSTSFLGFRGSDDLGGGLRARFGLETYLRVNDGSIGRIDADPFWSRTSYVGLQGAFGTSLLGRLPTPLWMSTRLFNPFGDSVGFSPSIRQYFGGTILGDSRWNNSVAFSSPDVENGFNYNFQFNAGQGSAGSTGNNFGANVLYTSGPLAATAVWQRVRNSALPLPAGFVDQATYQFGVSYETPRVRLYGQGGYVNTNAAVDVKTTLYQLGAVSPIGLGFLMASFGYSKTEAAGSDVLRRTYSLGYDYYLSKNTDIYAMLMGEQATGLTSGKAAAAGLRLRF